MRRGLVVGNWKMHGGVRQNDALLGALRGWNGERRLCVCVPFPFLEQARQQLAATAVEWGAQDVSAHAEGAYTGEVSAAMVAEFGARLVLVGHSERRTLHGEGDAMVVAKAQAALAAGLQPVVCVGETLSEREAGATERVILRQVDAAIAGLGARIGAVVMAYEPVWAIGTGRTASSEQAQEVHALIRKRLAHAEADAGSIALLYGGSVKADNAAALFAMPDIDGGLVGGASLKAAEFLAIAAA